MDAHKLIRASGISSMIGGLMLAIFVIAHETGHTDLGLGNVFWHTTESVALVFMQLGAVGMYALQHERIGWPGLIGFLTAFIGGGWFAATGYSEGYGILSDPPFFAYAIRIVWVVFFLGWTIFGIVIFRARMLPRIGALLCVLALPLGFVITLFVVQQGWFMLILIGVIFGIGQMILGWGLLRSQVSS